MRPLPFVLPWAVVFWAVFIWAYLPEFGIVRRGREAQGPADAKSLQVILVGQALAFAIAFAIAGADAMRFALRYQRVAFALGLAAIIGGSLLRRHCWRMLGGSFTGDVRARSDQEVVDRGAYKVLRHPAYTGGIILNTGIGIALGNWGSAVLLFIVSFAVYAYRISVEERALLAAIGEPYRRFMLTRKRLIPFVY